MYITICLWRVRVKRLTYVCSDFLVIISGIEPRKTTPPNYGPVYNATDKLCKYVCITTYEPDTKSSPNPNPDPNANPNAKQRAV